MLHTLHSSRKMKQKEKIAKNKIVHHFIFLTVSFSVLKIRKKNLNLGNEMPRFWLIFGPLYLRNEMPRVWLIFWTLVSM